jgi:soluble P-type ATPase
MTIDLTELEVRQKARELVKQLRQRKFTIVAGGNAYPDMLCLEAADLIEKLASESAK